MPAHLLFLAVACCLLSSVAVAADELTHSLGHYSLNQQRKFDVQEKGKDSTGSDGLTLANQNGLTLHFVYAAKAPDVVALAKEEAVPKAQQATAKTEITEFKANGLIGKRVIVTCQDPDAGEAVTELGFLGNGKDCVHWEINSLKKTYEADAKVIEAILGSIK